MRGNKPLALGIPKCIIYRNMRIQSLSWKRVTKGNYKEPI